MTPARTLWQRIILLLLLLGPALPAAAQTAPVRHVAMRLVAESDRPVAGQSVALALVSEPDAGWHGYWQNPGAVGSQSRLDWTLPTGASVGALRYPVPERLLVAGLMNYVYERPWTILTELRVPAGLSAGTPLPVRLSIDYLVCTREICVPEKAELATDLIVGDGAVSVERRQAFDGWRRALPRPIGSPAVFQGGDAFRLRIPFPADVAPDDAYFFAQTEGAIDYAAPQSVVRDGDAIILSTKGAGTPPVVEGVLATGEGQGYAIRATPGVVAVPREGGWWRTALLAFGGALLGGLLLNVMPCVFPILSLKALSLARAGESDAKARAEGVAYTAGAVATCMALGGLLLAIRAGGAAAGWAFQLTDPRIVLLLLLLTGGIALNLAGLFELPTPQVGMRSGRGGAFATGALAAFVATPCTGPFMGAALGSALILPPVAAMAVFAGLGLGLALPFLLLGFVPAFRRRLPKPGAWMDRLRKGLSVPMFATALALTWLLGRQAGVDGMTLGLAALLLFALGLWWTGRRQLRSLTRAWWPTAAALVLALPLALLVSRAAPGASATIAGAEPFSEARLAALRAQGRPVFAYFTADWCLTCKVNEKAAIETRAVADAFGKAKVAVLVGDWTDGDPALGRFIEAHNRAGVPLYLWYPAGATQPSVLPQVLTPATLTGLVTQ
ncbi:protein-disulfide reductase DsbD family protein [Sphingomonas sp. Leaf4]|uniref:protein-disulfide reductase DsbD family protein n=1 Tax=Sphingomonas sp. Leaf4 TaxID=2876553 RepID=UPI001E303552|nr:protein-disulfide reductase DsbD domain-containing protein [Sphingomonas sp. Leaf4]